MEKTPPSHLWYLGAFIIGSIVWMIGVSVSGSAWNVVRDANISASTEALNAKGASIAVFTDVVQANRSIECRAISVVNDESEVIPPYDPRIAGAPTVEQNGTTWHLIAFEQDGVDSVSVSCTPKDKGVDNAQYSANVVDGYRDRNLAGLAIMIAAVAGAIAVSLVVFVKRHRRV